MLTTYLLRNVDADMWNEFKDRATTEGHTIRWVLTALIAHYIRHGLPKGR